MNQPLVSVILPIFNGKRFLTKAIESILNQSYKNMELIILDDGSKDDSYNHIQEYTKHNRIEIPFKILKHNQNKGIAAAYNSCLAQCNGKLIAFQEQDDYSEPRRIESLVAFITENPEVAFVTGKVSWINEGGKSFNVWPQDLNKTEIIPPGLGHYSKLLIYQTNFSNTTCLLNKNVIHKNDLYFNEQFTSSSQDWDFHLRIVSKYPTARLPLVLVKMNRHQYNPSATSNKKRLYETNKKLLTLHEKHTFNQLFPEINSKEKKELFNKALGMEYLFESKNCESHHAKAHLFVLALLKSRFSKEISLPMLRRLKKYLMHF